MLSIKQLAYHHLSNTWEERFCSDSIYSWLPSDINGTALRNELCHLDRVEFFGMLDYATGVDVLQLQQAVCVQCDLLISCHLDIAF